MMNYHFGSKDNLCFHLMQSLPAKIVDIINEKYPALMKEDPVLFDLSITLIMVDSLLVNNEFMMDYRKMYSLPYVRRELTKRTKESLVIYYEMHNETASEPLLTMYSHAFMSALSSVAHEEYYKAYSMDHLKTKHLIENLFFQLNHITKDKERLGKAAIDISDSIHITMNAFDKFEIDLSC